VIIETVQCLVLHCSRCDQPLIDTDETDAVIHFADVEAIKDVFPADRPKRDMDGWRRLGDRFLCQHCTAFDEGTARWVELPPLRAADAARVLRAQAGYAQTPKLTEPSWPVGMTVTQFLAVLDDIRDRVAVADSFEGWVEYLMPDSLDNGVRFDVRAGYRVGNSQGQGGFRMIQGDGETP
jgi:hypothetical protein